MTSESPTTFPQGTGMLWLTWTSSSCANLIVFVSVLFSSLSSCTQRVVHRDRCCPTVSRFSFFELPLQWQSLVWCCRLQHTCQPCRRRHQVQLPVNQRAGQRAKGKLSLSQSQVGCAETLPGCCVHSCYNDVLQIAYGCNAAA
jgi:hypothetical protein